MIPSNQKSIETHAAIYGLALIIIFKLVKTLFSNLPEIMSSCIYYSFIIFLTGICVRDKNQSAFGIAKFFGLKSHDALTKMLAHKCWSASLLMLQLLDKAIELSLCCPPKQSWLALDDVILPKRRSHKTDGAYWDWDYVNGRHILCLRLVVVVWTNGIVRIPVAFACYHRKGSDYLEKKEKKFRSKNQLARTLIYQITRKALQFDYLVFDSWYASAENFRFFNRLKMTYVTALKSNRKLSLPYNPLTNKPKRRSKNLKWYKLTCTQWAAQKPYVRDYRYYKTVEARARKTLVFLEGVAFPFKLVCIKNYVRNKAFKEMVTASEKKAKDKNKYLVTNNLTLTIPQVIAYYRSRWTIEVLFRDCKQHLALGKCQAHKEMETHTRHTAMVFLAFTLLELTKPNVKKSDAGAKTIGDLKRDLQNQQLIYVNGQYQIIDASKMKLDWEKLNFLYDHLELDGLGHRETQLVFDF